MRTLAIVIGAAAIAGFAALSLGFAAERLQGACEPGFVKVVVKEAGSCLGDYKKRVANEPIAFCTVTRKKCVPENEKPR